jgi:tetrapyrrole methylase family protein / MazG family protein
MGTLPSTSPGAPRPRVIVVGLGPAGPSLVPAAVSHALAGASAVLVRTARHPAVAAVYEAAVGPVETLDAHYERGPSLDDVYAAIVEAVVGAAVRAAEGASAAGYVVYAVPGSPFVAERSVALLLADDRVSVEVVAAPSFLDLAWERLRIDPVAAGVRLVDGTVFAVEAAGERGPMLVAQCHSRAVLSEIKLAADDVAGEDAGRRAVVLHHLGLEDELVREVSWDELDRAVEPDHLTALWIPMLAPPVAGELVRLDELMRTLRARCPWDRRQTHASLARHLLEETYETLDAIDAVARAADHATPEQVSHLEEELGDLLFQIYFHSLLAAEDGQFTLADVARTVHDKLVARHPHVFAGASAATPEDVAARWEVLKRQEKGRASVTDGIPGALPALALSAKLQRKAESLGFGSGSLDERVRQIRAGLDQLFADNGASGGSPADASGETLDASDRTVSAVGDLLFALADAARRVGVDPETALRRAAAVFGSELRDAESRLRDGEPGPRAGEPRPGDTGRRSR